MAITAVGTEPKVLDAITRASAQSGVGFDYLLATAKRESGLDCQAKSKSSSACGLYQFVSQTWLSTMKAHGAEHGLGAYADQIERSPSGHFSVSDPAQQSAILALRNDPKIAASMAAELTADNAKVLSDRLGRTPSNGELYMAHVLGASGAVKLIGLAAANPTTPAADQFPDAASTNRGLFYDKAGAPVSVSVLATRLGGGARGTGAEAGLRASKDNGGKDADGKGSISPFTWAAQNAPTPTGSLGVWRAGYSAPLTLTPQVMAILSALHPPVEETVASRQQKS
jgi:hypothetical protein